MAATVQINRWTGSSGGPTKTDITGINSRAMTTDAHSTNATTNPIPVPTVGSTNIASSTNATPIVVTANSHGLSNNDMVVISGHTTNTNANGTWKIGNVTTNTFEITNRAGNGVGGATGTVRKVNCSYWVATRLNVTVAPSGTINNLKWYSDGSNSLGTGVAMKVATATSYVQATGTTGTTGDAMSPVTGGYGATLNSVGADFSTYTSGSPLSVTGTITATTGDTWADLVVYQVEVNSAAGPGTTPTETLTYQYDET